MLVRQFLENAIEFQKSIFYVWLGCYYEQKS